MFGCRAVCAPRDPTADTVKIDMDLPAPRAEQEEADRQAAEELQARIQAEEAEEAQRQAQEAEEAEQARLAEEEAARRRAEEERLRQLEEARRAEEARREREAAEEARRLEEEARKLEQARVEQERKNAVEAFLKEHKFKSATAPKKSMMATTYPIHTAAMRGDEEMVKMLIEEGADPEQKTSSGKTAAQVAEKKNSKGSHTAVLRVLGGA